MKSHRIPIILLAVALGVSLAFNILLYRQLYIQLNAIQLDPLGLGLYPPGDAQNLTKQPHQLRVVFFGDSRAYQWPAPEGLPQVEFINRGIGGQTSTQVAERFDAHIAPLQPDVLVVQVCVNDLHIATLLNDIRPAIIDNCQANLELIITEALKQDTMVILTTVFPAGEPSLDQRLFGTGDIGESIVAVNEFIHTLAGERVLILDTAAILAGETGRVRAEYSRDFLHLTDAGYAALNDRLAPMLIELAQEKSLAPD